MLTTLRLINVSTQHRRLIIREQVRSLPCRKKHTDNDTEQVLTVERVR